MKTQRGWLVAVAIIFTLLPTLAAPPEVEALFPRAVALWQTTLVTPYAAQYTGVKFIGAADLDGDGLRDLLFAEASKFYQLYRGLGGGRFEQHHLCHFWYPVEGSPFTYRCGGFFCVEAGDLVDFDADGNVDLVLCGLRGSNDRNVYQVVLRRNLGELRFEDVAEVELPEGLQKIWGLPPSNGSSLEILGCAVTEERGKHYTRVYYVRLHHRGNWEFGGTELTRQGEGTPFARLDLNGDDAADVLLIRDDGVWALFGSRENGFAEELVFPTSERPRDVAVGDLNGDGVEDLALAIPQGVVVALGTGGGFREMGHFSLQEEPFEIEVADFNGDGVVDLAAISRTTQVAKEGSYREMYKAHVSVLLGRGDGSFIGPTHIPTDGRHPRSIVAVDVDGDGDLDLVVANEGSGDLSVLEGDGEGGFGLAPYSPVVITPCIQCLTWVGTGDFDEDGRPDLVVIQAADDLVFILLNRLGSTG
ncbi:MAG TPA: VCBS repeat-containing protein [Candidatus Acetothermia bacterium]|nr:VCBS repeat-containing protein [Candidatus Acetothermia bacterium]